jgi:hypothetical protein
LICRFPGNPDVRWDFSKDSFWDMNDRSRGEHNDSCVTVYWPEIDMPAHSKRAMAITYGLGRIAGDSRLEPAQLALTFNPKPTPGSDFTITAWIKNPHNGQQVTLNVPDGMTLIDPSVPNQSVSRGKTPLAQVSWKVRVAHDARPELCKITASTRGVSATVDVPVRRRPTGIFLYGI